MTVFAFDRDWTVDVNPHPNRQAVPLDWVRTLAHETAHPVYAIGNQDLADEAAIPGVVDIVGKHPDDWGAWLGDKRPDGRYEQFPQRRERLALIAELHPEASDYVVVDDLDLSDVDGWDHYHAWEFVPAVKRGDVHPGLPWVGEPLPDGGEQLDDSPPPTDNGSADDSGGSPTAGQSGLVIATLDGPDPASLSTFLDEHDGVPGYKLTIAGDDGRAVQSCYDLDVIDCSVDRPESDPLVWCTPVRETEERFHASIDDIEQVTAVGGTPPDLVLSYGERPEQRARVLRRLAEDHPHAVRVPAVLSLLETPDDAPPGGTDERHSCIAESLRALSLVAAERPADCVPALPALERVLREGPAAGDAVKTMRLVAEARPADVAARVGAVVPWLTAEETFERCEATRCLVALAEAAPTDAVDAVDPLASVARDGGPCRPYAVYALSCVAAEFPDAVEPVAETLGGVVADDAASDGVRSNALSALGRVVGEHPGVGVPVVDEVVSLFDSDTATPRNNAIGLVGDVAKRHSDVVASHVAALAGAVTDDDTTTQINASVTLARVAEDAPGHATVAANELMTVLEADHEEVRRNACRALGQLAAALPDDAGSDGETVAADDPGNPDRATVAAALEHRQQADEAVAVSRAAEQALGRIRSAEGPR